MSEKNNIENQIAEIDEILRQIENGEISLSDVSGKYREALEKFSKIENELSKIENEIEVLTQDFSK
ncbi:MAG: exodeoxyribonuclease VII small subunit [bacterium]|nr:exodeoxyribonuclease VII small subunit [bacterium]